MPRNTHNLLNDYENTICFRLMGKRGEMIHRLTEVHAVHERLNKGITDDIDTHTFKTNEA